MNDSRRLRAVRGGGEEQWHENEGRFEHTLGWIEGDVLKRFQGITLNSVEVGEPLRCRAGALLSVNIPGMEYKLRRT